MANMSDFKHFFGVPPSDQNALDIFSGEWSSQPPASRPELKAGVTPLFDDPRITGAHHRLMEMGLLTGTQLELLRFAPMGDPLEIRVRGYNLSLRKHEADQIMVRPCS